MIKKLTLIKPDVAHPVKKQGYAGDAGLPTGLLYLAGYVRDRNDIEVNIIDQRLESVLGRKIDLAHEIADSDIVGVGACTAEAPGAMDVMEIAKEMEKITVMGGLFPTFNAEAVLRTGNVDFIVNGEGETGLSKLISALDGKGDLKDVKGIVSIKDGEIIRNGDKELIKYLDSIPLPAYDLVDMKEYAKLSPAAIYAARGCPMSCEFCTLNELWEYRYRRRSFENVLEELAIFKEAGFDRVHFKDETITLNKKWCGELFEEIENADLGMSYKAKSRVDGLSQELLMKMMGAGVDTIHSGIESISQRSLDGMAKQVRSKNIVDAFDLMLGNGCQVNPVYMVGWVGETPEDLAENVKFMKETGKRDGVITYVSFITPHPGSNLERNLSDGLRILSTDLSRYTHKQPVAVPISLGENGLQLMVDAYHEVGEACEMVKYNPKIDPEYLNCLKQAELTQPTNHERRYTQLTISA